MLSRTKNASLKGSEMKLFFLLSYLKNYPLPPFVEDMDLDGYLTRHICEIEQYWDPASQLCRDFSECYNPIAPSSKRCVYDYLEQFDYWFYDWDDSDDDYYDCFDTRTETTLACCPVFKYGADTYEYTEIEYYIVS